MTVGVNVCDKSVLLRLCMFLFFPWSNFCYMHLSCKIQKLLYVMCLVHLLKRGTFLINCDEGVKINVYCVVFNLQLIPWG